MAQKVEQKAIRQIVKVIAEKMASYPAEIAAFCDYDEKTVGQICRKLVEVDYLERLNPQLVGGDDRLRSRSHSVNGGIQAMKAMDWYGLNSDIQWRMKVWDSDKIINEYHQEVDVVLEDEEVDDAISNTYVRDAVTKLEERGIM